MGYRVERIFFRLRWNWWVTLLMITEIAVGICVYTYSSNLQYSLEKEESQLKLQERDMVLEILSKEEKTIVEEMALTLQDYNEIQKISREKAYIYISIPGFYMINDKDYNYKLLLIDYKLMDLEDTSAYWGSNLQDLMGQDLLSGFELQNKKMPKELDNEVWKTETEEIALRNCILLPLAYMKECPEDIEPAWIHVEWNSHKLENPEKIKEAIEQYLITAHGDFFNYRIYYPEIELSNNSEKVKTSIQAIHKAGVLFLLMVYVGMTIIFHLIYEHRKEAYGVSLACGANGKQLFKEILGEIFILNGMGTLIGSCAGVFITYYLDLQIMIGNIEVVGDYRTILLEIMICCIISVVISISIYHRLMHEKIIRLLNSC